MAKEPQTLDELRKARKRALGVIERATRRIEELSAHRAAAHFKVDALEREALARFRKKISR